MWRNLAILLAVLATLAWLIVWRIPLGVRNVMDIFGRRTYNGCRDTSFVRCLGADRISVDHGSEAVLFPLPPSSSR